MTAPGGSPRLIFREFGDEDLPALAALLADPEVMRFSWKGTYDLARSQELLKRFRHNYGELGFGKWALALRATGEFVGYCGFERCPPGAPDGIELGYRLTPKYWGQGLASEAAEASLNHVFKIARLPCIFAFLEPANVASVRVLEKCGFSRIARGVALNAKMMDIYRIDAPK